MSEKKRILKKCFLKGIKEINRYMETSILDLYYTQNIQEILDEIQYILNCIKPIECKCGKRINRKDWKNIQLCGRAYNKYDGAQECRKHICGAYISAMVTKTEMEE